jgi:hypothetical protein
MPDKNSSMEKAYEDAMAGKDAAKAEAKAAYQNAANAAKKQVAGNIAKKKKAAPLDPNFGMPAAKKVSPAKGMPY